MKVLVSCALKFHSDHLGYQLDKRGLLYRLITSFPYFGYKREPIDRKKILFLPPLFLVSRAFSKLLGRFYFLNSLIEWLASIYFDWLASFFVGSPDFSISWAWSSYRIIKKVQSKGGIAIVEECGSFNKYQEKILEEEYRRLGLTYRTRVHRKIMERERRECEIADYILCPSEYVARSLIEYGIRKDKIIIIPYGVSLDSFKQEARQDDTFRVLFVGTVGVRKGIIYLFQALENLKLPNFECLVIGNVEPCFQALFNKHSKLCKYIRRAPHSYLRYHYSNASVFLLPSIDEGMAYVQMEAMACGLPVICTPNTGAQELVRDSMEGFVVPIRDSEGIREKIEFLYNNPSELKRMSSNALERVKNYSWDSYGTRLVRALEERIKKI
jgi:glycosyltransferase involved in cell wall biosynthesis